MGEIPWGFESPTLYHSAVMKLADILVSGTSELRLVQVQVLSALLQPGWRNWQTRRHEEPVSEMTCRFKSCPWHYARVVKWKTQLAQTQPPMRAWRFDSSRAYQRRVAFCCRVDVQWIESREEVAMSTKVLVLDQGYEPHRIVDWQRAVSMIFQRAVEVLESYDEPLMSDEQAERAESLGWTVLIKMPAVVRLLRSVRSRKKAVKFSRLNVLTRDHWKCQFCGKKLPTKQLNYDHVVPRKLGGKTVWENIVTSCYPCNAKKRGRTPEQAGMKLRNRPVKPRSLPIMAFHFDLSSGSLPECWKTWTYWNVELESD